VAASCATDAKERQSTMQIKATQHFVILKMFLSLVVQNVLEYLSYSVTLSGTKEGIIFG